MRQQGSSKKLGQNRFLSHSTTTILCNTINRRKKISTHLISEECKTPTENMEGQKFDVSNLAKLVPSNSVKKSSHSGPAAAKFSNKSRFSPLWPILGHMWPLRGPGCFGNCYKLWTSDTYDICSRGLFAYITKPPWKHTDNNMSIVKKYQSFQKLL